MNSPSTRRSGEGERPQHPSSHGTRALVRVGVLSRILGRWTVRSMGSEARTSGCHASLYGPDAVPAELMPAVVFGVSRP